jgi:hypothetical protein
MTTQSDYISSITTSLLRILSYTEGTHSLQRIDNFAYQLAEIELSIAKDTGNPDKNVRQGRPALDQTHGEYTISDFLDGLQYSGFFGEEDNFPIAYKVDPNEYRA